MMIRIPPHIIPRWVVFAAARNVVIAGVMCQMAPLLSLWSRVLLERLTYKHCAACDVQHGVHDGLECKAMVVWAGWSHAACVEDVVHAILYAIPGKERCLFNGNAKHHDTLHCIAVDRAAAQPASGAFAFAPASCALSA